MITPLQPPWEPWLDGMWDIRMPPLCPNDSKSRHIGRPSRESGCWYGPVHKSYSRFIVLSRGGYIDIAAPGEIGTAPIRPGEEVYPCLAVKCSENLSIQPGEIPPRSASRPDNSSRQFGVDPIA